MGDSRTKNTKRNIAAGMAYRLVAIILPFINRTAILYILGAELTGLDSLFNSILHVLNIADLGFNSAVVYSLYKPFADKDYGKICEIVSLLKKIYFVVGSIILVAGMACMPFLKFLINGDYPSDINLQLLFFLYLINSVLSYFLFAYKESLLIADQRKDVADTIRTIVNILRYIGQLVILYITKSFYLYLVVSIIGTILTNLLINRESKKRYGFFQEVKGKTSIPKSMKEQIKGLLVDRLGDTCRNSFDSMIISSFLGLTATAIYGNYYYIYASLYMIMLVLCNSMSASVGNSIVKESKEKNYSDLQRFTFLFSWIAGWCTVCMACLYQPFMKIWVGDQLLLSDKNMILFCIYFYAINMTNIRNQYISGTGIWYKLRIPCIVEALANLLLNVILGKLFGISGVVIATIITIFVFNFTWRTGILFKEYFTGIRFSKYFSRYMYYAGVTAIATATTIIVCQMPRIQGILGLAIRFGICLIVPNCIFFLFYRFLKEYDSGKKLLKQIIRIK